MSRAKRRRKASAARKKRKEYQRLLGIHRAHCFDCRHAENETELCWLGKDLFDLGQPQEPK